MVDIEDNGRKVITCRSRDDNLASTCIDVSLSLCLAGVEAGALQNNIDLQLTPRKILCILLLVDLDLLAVDNDGMIGRLNSALIMTMSCIILKKISKHLRAGQIVDCDNIITRCLEHLTECKASNTAKAIDCNSYCHNLILLDKVKL